MEIKETLDNLNQEITKTILRLSAKSREQSTLSAKMQENSDQMLYLSSILQQLNEEKEQLEMVRRIADAERKTTDLDCRMLKMGARLT